MGQKKVINKEANANIPRIIVDTGTLFTLLLAEPDIKGVESSKGEYVKDYGYLSLLVQLAQKGLIKLVIPDMVLAEFVNSPAPLQKKDFEALYKSPAQHAASIRRMMTYRSSGNKDIVIEYAKAPERIQFIYDLFNSSNVEIFRSDYGKEYLQRIIDVMQKPKGKKLQQLYFNAAQHSKPSSVAVLKRQLLSDTEKYAPFVRKLRKLSLRKDSGERACADAIWHYQKNADGHPTMLLYQGTDVCREVIRRINNYHLKKRGPGYGKEACNPHGSHETFNPQTLEGLGEGSFLTTYGFLAPLVERFAKLRDPQTGRSPYIISPGEWDSRADSAWNPQQPEKSPFIRAFQPMIDNAAKELGGSGARGRYRALKDVRFADVVTDREHEHAWQHASLKTPWREVVMRWGPAELVELARDHTQRRLVYERQAAKEAGADAADKATRAQTREESLALFKPANQQHLSELIKILGRGSGDRNSQASIIPTCLVDRIEREATIGKPLVPGRPI